MRIAVVQTGAADRQGARALWECIAPADSYRNLATLREAMDCLGRGECDRVLVLCADGDLPAPDMPDDPRVVGMHSAPPCRHFEEQVRQRTAILQATVHELRQELVRRVEAEELLRREQDRFRTLVETIPYGVQEVDRNGTITFANEAFHRIYGYPTGTLIGMTHWEMFADPVQSARLKEFFHYAMEVELPREPFAYRVADRSGQMHDLQVAWDYKRDAHGGLAGFVAVVSDITAQLRAEREARQRLEELTHVARLATMGELVSSLSHELNQPLAAIANFAQAGRCLAAQLPAAADGDLPRILGEINSAAHRAGEIIRRLRAFARRHEPRRSTVHLHRLVGSVVGLLQAEAQRHGVELRVAASAELPAVLADSVQIEQVIVNLVKNAIDAVAAARRADGWVEVQTSVYENGAAVAVNDNGCGFTAAEEPRLFEPFFTTKPDGMGLGLSISRSIMHAHGGRIEACRIASGGSTFRFVLPFTSGGG